MAIQEYAPETAKQEAHPAQPVAAVVTGDITFEEWLQQYAAVRTELENGVVIFMSPVRLRHDSLFQFLIMFVNAYLSRNPVGQLRVAPFVMRTSERSAREPDLQVILKDNAGTLTETAMLGASDLCIEIVSPESVARDYGVKFEEYEAVGVREYLIIDPLRKAVTCFQRGSEGYFVRHEPDADGQYAFLTLPGLRLPTALLWSDPLPNFTQIAGMVSTSS